MVKIWNFPFEHSRSLSGQIISQLRPGNVLAAAVLCMMNRSCHCTCGVVMNRARLGLFFWGMVGRLCPFLHELCYRTNRNFSTIVIVKVQNRLNLYTFLLARLVLRFLWWVQIWILIFLLHLTYNPYTFLCVGVIRYVLALVIYKCVGTWDMFVQCLTMFLFSFELRNRVKT